MPTACSSMESHRSLTKYSSYTKIKPSQTMPSNVATRKRRGSNCDEQVLPNKSLKLKDQAAACSNEKSLKDLSKSVDEDEIVVIYDSLSNSVSNQNGNSRTSDAFSIKSNTRLIHNNHADCNMVNVNDSRNLNPDVIIDTNNNSKDEQNSVGSCNSTSQSVQRNLSSNENKENLFIYTSNCRNQLSEIRMKDDHTRVGSRKYGKTTSNANSTITMKQYYGAIESNQNNESLSSFPYLVDIGHSVIKMEEELQITDTNEDAVWNSINEFSMPIVYPIAFEQVHQQPKTEFSEEAVVTLIDTEEDTVPYFQLFDGYRKKTSMNQEVDKEVIKVEAKAEPEDADISLYASDNRDGSFPYSRSFDRFDMNTSMNQEVDKEVIKVEVKDEPVDARISSYASDNRVGSFLHPRSFDRFDMNTSRNQEVDKEVIKVEVKDEPVDADISLYASDNRVGSFPHPRSFNRFDMNTSRNQEVDREVIKVEPKTEPEDADISLYASDNRVGSFPYPRSFDRFDTNTSRNQEVDREVIKVEAKIEPEDADISLYACDNRVGSLPYPRSFDRFDMNTSRNQEVDREVIKVEAKTEPEDADISSYASDNRNRSFLYHPLFDRFDMNTSMNQEVDEEAMKVEAEAEPEDAGISSYTSDDRDGSFLYNQLFDRFDMNTSMNQKVDEEVTEEEAETEPEDSGVSSYVSDNRDGSFPYPPSFDRFDMNSSTNQEVDREVRELEVETKPEDSDISLYGNDDVVDSSSDSHDEDYMNWMRKLCRSRTLSEDEFRKEVKNDHVAQEVVGHALDKSAYKPPLNMTVRLEANRGMEMDAVNRAIRLKESTSDSTISRKKSFKNKTSISLSSRRQEKDSCPTSSTTKPAVTHSKKSLVRKVLQIEPLHLPTRRRNNSARQDSVKPPKERLSSKEKKELKEIEDQKQDQKKNQTKDQRKDQKKRRAQNESPDCLPQSKKKASSLSNVEKEQLIDDRKKELKEKDQKKCREQNQSPDCPPPSNRKASPLIKVEKEQLMDDRKKKLKEKDQKKCREQNQSPDCPPPSNKKASPLIKVEKEQLMDDRKKKLKEKDQKKCREQNQSPDCPPPSNKKASLLTRVKKEQSMDVRKKELKKKDQKKRRAQNESPDCPPPSKKKASLLSNVEKEQLMDDRKKELKEMDQKKCRAQNEKKVKEKVKIEEYTRAKDWKKCRAQKMSPLTKEEKKQLIDARKQKLKQIALKERRSSQTNNLESNSEHNSENNPENNPEYNPEYNPENNLKKKRKALNVKNTFSAWKVNNVEEKPKSNNLPAVANAVLASPMSQEIKDIKSISRRVEVAKYKSTEPVTIASSFLKSPEKMISIKTDESNVLNRLAGKEAPMPRKSMNDEMINNFLLRIFKWHPNWLDEQKSHLRLDKTAPVVSVDEVHDTLTHYKSYDEYYRTMLPRLLLETWYGVTRGYPPIDNYEQRMCSIIENSIQMKTLSSNLQLTTLMLEVLVTREDREKKAYPSEGDLVVFEYPSIEPEGQTFIKVFAYVEEDYSTILSDSTHYNKELANYVGRPYALRTYTIRTKPLRSGILVNRIAKIRCLSKFRPNLNTVQALEYLPKSPLVNLILNPKIEEYCLPTIPIHSEQLFTREKLNKKQLEAVLKVTETIVQNQKKLCFIQGPSGTGKSTVIVNILSQVLYKKKWYTRSEGALKILVCAPTNAAIDEITLRLLQIRSSTNQNWFNIVRIGQTGVTDPIVKNISVTELTKQKINRMGSISERISSLKCKMASTHNMCDCEERMQMKMTSLIKKESVRMQQDAETAVLSQADIITCTLSSMYSKQTENFFMKNKKEISVCIMDEATQITEADTLIPLMLGVNTLVLVGDPNQLPATVPSPRGKIEGRDQSIFSRVQNAFGMNPANPIIMLDTQYRMSRDIWQWPSKFFYAGNLETGTPPNEEFPFHSYRLFNIYNSENKYNSNIAEAQFVANIIYTMLTTANFDGWECISYGILTPYNNQKLVIQTKINDKLSLLPENVKRRIKFEVSTIDGFRGKERDVIILSCVRSQIMGCLSDMQRLCVALTRAKHCMIICGNIGLFNKDPNWNSLLSDAKSRNVYFNVDAEAESWEIKQHVVKRCRSR